MPGLNYIEKLNFAGGLNDSLSPLASNPNQCSDILNFCLEDYPIKRKGFGNYPATQSGSNQILCLAEFKPKDSPIRQIAIRGTAAYQVTNNAWDAISGGTGLSATERWQALNTNIAGASALILTSRYNVPQKVMLGGEVIYDTCDVITGWNASNGAGAVTVNNSVKIQGVGALNLISAANVTADSCDATTGWTATSPASAATTNSSAKKEGSCALNLFGSANTTIDTCDGLTGWNKVTSAPFVLGTDPTLDTSTYKEGSASINVGCISTGVFGYGKTWGGALTDGNTYVQTWVYVTDKTKLASAKALEIAIWTNTGGGYFLKSYAQSALSNGWNLIGGQLSTFSNVGFNNYTGWAIEIHFFNISAITHGDIKMDYWHLWRDHTYTWAKTISPVVNGTTYPNGYVWVYIDDTNRLASTGAMKIYWGTDSTHYYLKSIDRASLANGWNLVGGQFLVDYTATGGPTITSLGYLRIDLEQADGVVNVPTGAIVMDYWHAYSDKTLTWKKDSTSVDGTIYTKAYISFYIDDTDKLATTGAVTIYVGSDADSKYYTKTYNRSALVDGWNKLGGVLATDFTSVNTPTTTALDWLRIDVEQAPGAPNLSTGECVMDYWYGVANDVTCAALGGTPPRAKYAVEFNGIPCLLNCKNNAGTINYPARMYIGFSGGIGNPEMWTMSYDFDSNHGHEITGAAIAGGRLIVFREKGIYEVDYTGRADIPLTILPTVSNVGAYHYSVKSAGSYVLFANASGVYRYFPGGHIDENPISIPITESWKSKVVRNGNWQDLKIHYADQLEEYWIACGKTAGKYDEILVYNTVRQGWTIFGSALADFDVATFAEVTRDNTPNVWIGLTGDHCLYYDKQAANYADYTQAGVASNISTTLVTNWFHFNTPAMDKLLQEIIMTGNQKGAGLITVGVYTDLQNDLVTIGAGSFADVNTGIGKMKAVPHPAGSQGKMHRVSLTESGGASADSTWTIYSMGIRAQLTGF